MLLMRLKGSVLGTLCAAAMTILMAGSARAEIGFGPHVTLAIDPDAIAIGGHVAATDLIGCQPTIS